MSDKRGKRPPCGTQNGYVWHIRHHEEPCQSCRAVNAAASRAYRATGSTVISLGEPASPPEVESPRWTGPRCLICRLPIDTSRRGAIPRGGTGFVHSACEYFELYACKFCRGTGKRHDDRPCERCDGTGDNRQPASETSMYADRVHGIWQSTFRSSVGE